MTTPPLLGQCHCGSVSVQLTTARPPTELPARACTCSFCRPRHLRWTSDPAGAVAIATEQDANLHRYRFGTETADFLMCRRCGFVIAALADAEAPHVVVNVDVFARAAEFPFATSVELADETLDQRVRRRAKSWTPARLNVDPTSRRASR